MKASAIYTGHVVHRRHKPKLHQLRYACFWLLVDLDELPALDRGLKLFSHNRWNLFCLRNGDYGDRSGVALGSTVERELASAGLDFPVGAIHLLTMPRLFGYAFNPLSVFYCYDSGGMLRATLYEVRNTFGERHRYLIPVATAAEGPIVQSCEKVFHVSPFMDMGLRYTFRLRAPAAALNLAITASDGDARVLDAWLAAKRRPITDRALALLLLTHPLLTFKVIAAIHYEALLMVFKGFRLRDRPRPPASAVTTGVAIDDTKGAP